MDDYMFEYHYNECRTSAINAATDEYKGLTERIDNTTKYITSLLICLGGIVTALAALFTAYCICMPKNSIPDYIMFAINVLIILLTFIVDCAGITTTNDECSKFLCVDMFNALMGTLFKSKKNVKKSGGYVKSETYDAFIDGVLGEIDRIHEEYIANNQNENDVEPCDIKSGQEEIKNMTTNDKIDIFKNEISMYRNASKEAREVLTVKRRWLLRSVFYTGLSIVALFSTVLVTMIL